MVWGLFPVDPLSGEDKYYIFAKGTYKVGRKGCDIIINKDKGVSRIHAEIIVNSMTSLKKSSNVLSDVQIKDCSKYGTFVKTDLGTREKVHELPNKEIALKDGDLVSFGTGNATYRFCFVPLTFFIGCCEPFQMNHLVKEKVSSIGACATHRLSQECTHVLVDQHMPVKEDLVDAIVAKKPFVLISWLEFLAEEKIRTEIPSCTHHIPSITVEGVSVQVVDPKTRENCLEGYTFLLESRYMYKFEDRFQSLLQVGGAKTISIKEFCPSSQDSQYAENNQVVYAIPRGSEDKFNEFNKLRSLSRVNEMNLLCAVISGHLAPSVLISPSVFVSSSCSTDETVVADSDTEAETAASIPATRVVDGEDRPNFVRKAEVVMTTTNATISGGSPVTSFRGNDIGIIAAKDEVDESQNGNSEDKVVMRTRREKVDGSECGNLDIIYSQGLIVRDSNLTSTASCVVNKGVVDFKRFRKTNTQSGNSFSNLVPFSKYPYKDSDYESEAMIESVNEEKKRKQMEAIAEDLFNNEKGRRRGVAGSLRGLLTRAK